MSFLNKQGIWNTFLNEKQDIVKIGDNDGIHENLLLNTNQGITGWNFNLGNQWTMPDKSEINWLGVRAFQAITKAPKESYTNSWRLIYYNDNNIFSILSPSTQYTISFDSTIKHTSLQILQGNGINSLGSCSLTSETKTDENNQTYYHLIGTFTTPATLSGTGQYVYIGSNMNYLETANNIVKYANIKIEKGAISTLWIPARQDYGIDLSYSGISTSAIQFYEI